MEKRSESYKVLKPVMYQGRVFKPGRIVTFHPKNAKRFVDKHMMMKLDTSGAVDIMRRGLEWPDDVVILGSGPNGVPAYPMLKGKLIVGLNEAVYAPVDIAIWAAQDPTLKDQKWFDAKAIELKLTGRKFGLDQYNNGEYPTAMFDRTKVAKYYPWFKLVFDVSKPMLGASKINWDSPRIAQGATIGGSFMQVIVKTGKKSGHPVKRIILCGIDMFGNLYFNKRKHKNIARKGKVWSSAGSFDRLIKQVQEYGIEVVTVSKTALRNPQLVEKL